MALFSPLDPWIYRKTAQPPFRAVALENLDPNVGCGVVLDHCVPVHEADSLKPQSLEAAWQALRAYVAHACQVIDAGTPPILDSEETGMILTACGEPPAQCYPLYVMTVQLTGARETVVYVGKTSSTVSRFAGGHSAMTKLHAPEFDGAQKRLYLGCATYMDHAGEYLPLEAIEPLQTAQRLLLSLEAQMIHHYQPALNGQAKRRLIATDPTIIHLQGFEGGDDDHWIWPPAGR